MNQPDNSSQQAYHIEDAIDLRPYLLDLLNAWKLLLGIPLLVGVILYLYIQSTATVSYQSTALVAISEANFSVTGNDVNARVETASNFNRIRGALPELALSDALVDALYHDTMLQPLWPESVTEASSLKSHLIAIRGDDSRSIRLSANFAEPELPATVVNRWAELYIETVNQTYGTSGVEALAN